ncbi:MAG: RNHCP domain-containing protein [Spirochaetales bacterium]|nr:RNHCP domain-containing protein [Spirochaetales bacterium]
MSRVKIINSNPDQSFICVSCGKAVSPLQNGGNQRNHCPYCLCSMHVDIIAGDRRSGCKGVMVPISIWIRKNSEWSVIHRCENCGVIKTNRIAADDNEMLLFSLAASFMTQLPFPASRAIEGLMEFGRVYKKETEYEQ